MSLLLGSCALGGAPEPAADADHEELDGPMSQAASAPRELRAHVEGLALSIDPILERCVVDGVAVWRLRGRSDVELSSVASWVSDDAFGSAELTSTRAFAITFRDPSEQNTMASGLPIFLTVTPASGVPAEAAIWVRPRVAAGAGAGLIRFYATVQPRWVAGDVEYRGKVAVPPTWSVAIARAPGPRTVELAPGKVRLAWTFDELAATLRAEAPQLTARAVRGDATVQRVAALEVRVTRVGLTRGDPREVWPSVCKDSVRECLRALPADALDAETCGTYREVLACGGPPGAQ